MSGNGTVRRDVEDFKGFSSQPRFKADTQSPADFFFSMLSIMRDPELIQLEYSADSRKRDRWLREFVKKEPNLLGVLNTVIDIDKNRGWHMVGGRNQVRHFTEMFHDYQASPGLWGWRSGISIASKSFWSADLGSITEIGRDGRDGPMAALYAVDPANCRLTGKEDYPLEYFPLRGNKGKPIKWRNGDFIRASSHLSDDENYMGLGYCAVSRCIDLARLMIAVYEYDNETLGTEAPTGLLLLHGLTEDQWKKAMESRKEDLVGREIDYFSNVAVLATRGDELDAKLLAMSNLPASFNLREWMDMVIFGYALAFGFDPSEFWPVQFGAMGRGTETEIQHEKSTGKGRLDFPLTFEEQIREFLPDSLAFEFDQRDDKGDQLKAQVNQSKANVIKTLYESGIQQGQPLITWEEARDLLASPEYAMIPKAWAEIEAQSATDQEVEEGKVDLDDAKDVLDHPEEHSKAEIDTATTAIADAAKKPAVKAPAEGKIAPKGKVRRLIRDELMSKMYIIRASEKFPRDPIVQYDWPSNTEIILWNSGEELRERMYR